MYNSVSNRGRASSKERVHTKAERRWQMHVCEDRDGPETDATGGKDDAVAKKRGVTYVSLYPPLVNAYHGSQ